MKLTLDKPIVFFDIEATGLDTQLDRIVELSCAKVFPDGERKIKTLRFNPGIPIPPEATKIHGITDEDVANEKPFSAVASHIHNFILDCDLGGYNCNYYDIPLLSAEFQRSGIEWDYKNVRFFDVGNIFKRQEARSLEAAVKFYCQREHDGAHGAEADVLATIDVFEAQLERYEDLPTELDKLHLYCNYDKPILDLAGKFTYAEDGCILLNFGKHKGKPAESEPGFLQWMLDKDFAPDTKAIAMRVLRGDVPEDDTPFGDE